MKAGSIVIAVTLSIAACTVPTARNGGQAVHVSLDAPAAAGEANKSAPVATGDYAYELLTPRETGLSRAFDDGRRTFLAFAGGVPKGLMIFDENGKTVSFDATEGGVIIDTVRRGWLIRTPTHSSYAQTRQAPSAERLEESAAADDHVNLPAELAAARAEILSAQERLLGVSAELDKVSRGEPSRPLADLKAEIEELETQFDGINATLIRAHFASGSAVLVLSEEARSAMSSAARQADWVRVRGGADSTGSPEINARIALARAQSLRRVLIDGGIGPDKVTVSTATQDYIATNRTVAGRSMNRRVDVYFVGKGGEPTRVISQERTQHEIGTGADPADAGIRPGL
jgi:outer membrane protein OmpA-like peptidoglycan-associated protein